MKVIVTGSLGNIGKPLATALIRSGHLVTVISSNPEKKKDIEALGAIAAIGSLDDTAFLTSIFAGADALYAMVPTDFSQADPRSTYRNIGHAYATAIKQTGIKRVVSLSSIGAHLDKGTGFILGAYDLENILNELTGVGVTHLRAGTFYNNLYRMKELIKGMGIMGANYGDDDRIVMASPRDIAAAAMEELESTGAHQRVRYVVSGEYTANEAARIIGAAIGKPQLKWLTFPDGQLQQNMEGNGLPAHIAANFVELGASIHSGVLFRHYDLQKPVPIGKVKLEEFAQEFAAYFNS
jgi:uncharacterized protein YbjT (DUF2867 family)